MIAKARLDNSVAHARRGWLRRPVPGVELLLLLCVLFQRDATRALLFQLTPQRLLCGRAFAQSTFALVGVPLRFLALPT